MKIPPELLSLEEFPTSAVFAEGIKSLRVERKARSVETILGVEYAAKSGMKLHLDILAPRVAEGDLETFPLVMFVQGSAWRRQNLAQQLAQLTRFAASGLVIAMVEYRPSDLAPFPAQIRDARTATRFMLEHAAEYRADPGRLVAWGDSSGGHTATMLALTEGLARFSDEAMPAAPLGIRGVVDYYGPSDLGSMNDEPSIQDHDAPDSPEGRVLGGVRVSENPELIRESSPLAYIDSSTPLPPFLIVHGDKDRLVPFGQSVMLYRKLRECGHAVDMYRLKGADHSGEEFWSGEATRTITAAFIISRCSEGAKPLG